MTKHNAGAGAPQTTTQDTTVPITVTRQDGETVAYVRRNAWHNGGTFANPDLLWYAKAVGVMMSRPLNDPNSWWFFAAIHGQDIADPRFPGWGHLPAPPQVPTTPLPAKDVRDRFWDQCQHQTWYFAPWHRGYLVALEAQIRKAVVSLGGPATWALPYWNYFAVHENHIPPAFMQTTLPDGSPNPLYVKARYGPSFNGEVYVPRNDISLKCERETIYTGSDRFEPGFGGLDTGFNHGGGANGRLESDPHNIVHVKVGGSASSVGLLGGVYGLMSDPDTAALDPIFYVHHANIDRMWAAWNAHGHANPTEPEWLQGPAAVGEREFVMPMPDGTSWAYTPADVTSMKEMDYTYEDLSLAGPVQPDELLAKRLVRLGVTPAAPGVRASAGGKDEAELVGTHDGALPVTSAGARATVRLDPQGHRKLKSGFAAATATAPPDRVYLTLENVRAAHDGHSLEVHVNGVSAGKVHFFGVRKASETDGKHGGEGMTFVLDITDIVDDLHLRGALDAASLDVRIAPEGEVHASANITIGRVSVHRKGSR